MTGHGSDSDTRAVNAPRAEITLGHSELRIFPIGLGCMGMSQFYGEADSHQSVETIRAAIDLGVNFFDTSDIYGAAQAFYGQVGPGFGHNEELLGRAIRGRRDGLVLGTKFGGKLSAAGRVVFDGSAEYVARACEASLRRLGTDHIDVYYYHRLDPTVPIEETVGAMAELVKQGKVRAIGLSEMEPDILRRAAAVHPISALQSEYSLWERRIEAEILPTCRELNITLVPYSPLGRAALTGRLSAGTTFPDDDFRSTIPRFSGENLDHNLRLVQGLAASAHEKGCTPGQIALAWLLAQPHDVAPIPGTKHKSYVTENAAASAVALSADDIAALNEMFDPSLLQGARYAES
jgi:aryl-alcohol dehydrogenase-like predicted oxidoreductase